MSFLLDFSNLIVTNPNGLIEADFNVYVCSKATIISFEKFAHKGSRNNLLSPDTTAEKTYAVSLVNNKKDPTCGMPVTAGISDTAHYEKNVLGFCSVECKNEFLKNPKANLAAAEIK
ncbi:MAG: hypothetical protein RIT41_1389 [Bacteroidota bacterium]